ncbi:hypothetical protein [Vibrio coralliilyticus]|uniref:hypothetical protein n=1 Tax=Vibrio coralliilyticus TaxID=190893 RepID=UPI001C0F5C5E|nr:hypothetical protein [Vibrio coralliilyticus]
MSTKALHLESGSSQNLLLCFYFSLVIDDDMRLFAAGAKLGSVSYWLPSLLKKYPLHQ